MNDKKLWREEGPKALVEFLSNATGEDYDAAVYDTKLEFDSSNLEAVRYIASVAMSKAEPILMDWKREENRETFEYPMPADGSVAPYDSEEGTEVVRRHREDRLYREQHHEGPCLYVPDALRYCRAVTCALCQREIPFDDMTDEEKRQFEKMERAERRSDMLYRFWHCYFPIAFGIFSLIFIIYKLSHH